MGTINCAIQTATAAVVWQRPASESRPYNRLGNKEFRRIEKLMLRYYTAGESHGQALLAFVSGLPAGLPIDVDAINHELHRRQLGYGRGGRQKIEKDRADIFAGVRHGKTIGAPIARVLG